MAIERAVPSLKERIREREDGTSSREARER
jgi:hypothetical protein